MSEDIEIPQATLSSPELRGVGLPWSCRYCGEEVPMIHRQGPFSIHPFCARREQAGEPARFGSDR